MNERLKVMLRGSCGAVVGYLVSYPLQGIGLGLIWSFSDYVVNLVNVFSYSETVGTAALCVFIGAGVGMGSVLRK